MLEPWVVRSVSLPSCSSRFICTQMWNHPVRQLTPHPPGGPSATALPRVLSAWLPSSVPPTGLDECLFFNSLVVGLRYSLVLSVLVVFVYKFVVVLHLVVQRGKVYLPTPPSWLEVSNFTHFIKNILAVQGSLRFCMTLRMDFFIPTKNTIGILIGIILTL